MYFYRIEDKNGHGPYNHKTGCAHTIFKAKTFDCDFHNNDEHKPPTFDGTVTGTCGFASLLDLYRWFCKDISYLNRYFQVSVYCLDSFYINCGRHQATIEDFIHDTNKPIAHLSVKDAVRIARRVA